METTGILGRYAIVFDGAHSIYRESPIASNLVPVTFFCAMKIVSFIECRQRDVIERILRHCGLWDGPLRTLASARGPPGRTPQVPDEPRDLELVLDPEFMAAELGQSGTHRCRELRLVLDPEFLLRPTSGPDRRDLFERFFRRQPSGALTVRAQIIAFSRVPRNKRPKEGFKRAFSLEGIHAGSSRTAKSIGPSALPGPDDDCTIEHNRNTATHADKPPEQVGNEQEKSGIDG